MRSSLRFSLLLAFLLPVSIVWAQQATTTNCPGIPGACGYPANSNNQRNGGPPQNPQNGNQTLGQIYNFSKCGLNFSTASQRLGRRGSLNGVLQPAPFVITGIPACATIERAYLWTEGSGTGMAQTATIVNPNLVSTPFPMTLVGSGPDKCWGYAGSHTYRADVTACITGNGTYNISGILTNPPTAGNDMDGATLMVIWADPTVNYRGTMVIHDGAMVVNGGTTTQTVTGLNVCQTTVNARAFCMVGDIQLNGQTLTMNGTNAPFVWNWWNYVSVATTVNIGQNNANYTLTSGGDCFNLCVIGMYYQTTNCAVCPQASALQLNMSATPATCSVCNGTATVNVVPAGNYNYSWAPSGGNTATASGLCAGTHTVTVTNSCYTMTATVNVPAVGGNITSTAVQNNVLCNGQCNGSLQTTATSGNGPYTYTWSPFVPNITAGPLNNAFNLCTGTYSVTVTDANGCTGQQVITITEPPDLTLTPSTVNESCSSANGNIAVAAAGGSPNYSWVWSANANTGNSNTASNLAAGSYTCTATDANGCIETITVTLTNTPGPTLQVANFTDITCFGANNGTATVNVSSGQAPYTYAWSTGGAAAAETNMPPGTHTLTVTDANGCIATITVTIAEPTQLTTQNTQTDVLCFGGSSGDATVTPSGGTPNYTYFWSNAAVTNSTSNLQAGNYSCVITDANGCTAQANFTITEPPQITLAMSATDENCNQSNGTVGVIASGGSPGYQYVWNPGNLQQQNGSGLPANSYSVVVTDANGCTATDNITVNNLSGVTATLTSSTNPQCFGDCNGSATISASGGNNPVYSYAWSSSANNNPTENNLCAGNYSCVVTDGDGCSTTVNIVILQPAQLVVNVAAQPWPAVCNGGAVPLFALANGGSPNYTYNWMPGNINGNNPSVSPSTTTTYVITATDNNGCTALDSMVVTISPVPVADLLADVTSGCMPLSVNFSDLSAVAAPGNITSWAWDFGDGNTSNQQNPSHTYNLAGPYNVTLTVTTADGCTHTIVMNNYINVFALPTAAFTAGPQPTTILNPIINFTDASINATTWNWTFGDLTNASSTDQNPSFEYPASGCYEVVLTVRSADGCVDMASDSVCIDPDMSLYVPNAFTPNGDGSNDMFFAQGLGIDPDKFEMWIFDRWGNLIFYSDNMNKGWDGKVQGSDVLCQIDTYVWKIKVVDETGKKQALLGRVSIIR